MKRFFITCIYLTVFCLLTRAQSGDRIIALLPGELWYGGCVADGQAMPYKSGFSTDMNGDTKLNQAAPLLLSTKGRYIWSDMPFAFCLNSKSLHITQTHAVVVLEHGGSTLREAFKAASARFFKPEGKTPDTALLAHPQYNTWIELTYNQNQQDILKYAHGIVDNGLPPGVLMIDDSWAPYYGNFTFRKDRFTDARQMIAELHQLGFKVMLWVCPFVSADSEAFRDLESRKLLLMDAAQQDRPALIKWWNGYSATLDFTNVDALDWFKTQLQSLTNQYGIDGFKFDAGDAVFYRNTLSAGKATPNQLSEQWGVFGEIYPLNEYRAMWKRGGQPLGQRLLDKNHNWDDLQKLIPQVLTAGLLGYSFTCPDMIGGGDFMSFKDKSKFDQDLVVRSAQIHTLMPMMQFSVAPWRVLDAEHLAAVKKAVTLREQLTPYILQLAKASAQTGEPIVRSLEYQYPNQGYANIKDEFMLGDQYLVAPAVTKSHTRTIKLPVGNWKEDTGRILKGGIMIKEDVSLDRLVWFERVK